MIEVNNIPSLEELAEGIRKIEVKVPDKKTLLDKELLFMRVKGATFILGDAIDNNDIVVLKVSGGSNKRYNKDNVEITVGMNLYSKDIEDTLLGMKVNESKAIAVDGADITFTVRSIKKKVYGEITLEQAKAEDPTITSVDEYKNKIYQEIFDKLISDKAEKVQLNPMIKKLIKTVDIKFNYEEADKEMIKTCNDVLEQLREGLEDEKSHDYMAEYMRSMLIDDNYVELNLKDGITKEEYINSLNDEDLIKFMNEKMVINVRNVYIKLAFCEKNGMDLSKEAYENMVKKQSEIYKMSVERYKQQNTYVTYRYFDINKSINKMLIDYLKKDLIEVIVK